MAPAGRRALAGVAALAAAACLPACAASIRESASRAADALPAGTAARLLGRDWEALDGGRRFLDLRLTDRVRALTGEGVLLYRTEPLRLRLEVFGPHATPVLSLVQRGDSLAVRLHEEDRLVEGRVGDPAFAELAEGRGFTGQEILGALLGAYDAGALVEGPADTVAWRDGGELAVALLEPDRAHLFTWEAADSTLREYRQDRGGRAAYRVRFSDWRTVEGRRRPFRIEAQDVAGRRTLRAAVRRETFVPEEDDAFRLPPS
jgi:hypothetical protein